jgi:hypothetical protein
LRKALGMIKADPEPAVAAPVEISKPAAAKAK